MPTMEQIEEGYFNYLVNEIFKALDSADKYNCTYFEIVRVNLMLNLKEILKTKQFFDEIVDELRIKEKNKILQKVK